MIDYERLKRWQSYGSQKLSSAMFDLALGWGDLPSRIRTAWNGGLGVLSESQMPSDETLLLLRKIRAFFLEPEALGLRADQLVVENLDQVDRQKLDDLAYDVLQLNDKIRALEALAKREGL